MPEIDKGKNNMSENIEIEKINKYQIIADLQTFYRDTTSLEGIDIQIQASKILAYIYENPILQNLFTDKVNKFVEYVNKNQTLFELILYFCHHIEYLIDEKPTHLLNDYQNDERFRVNMGACEFLREFVVDKNEYLTILNETLIKMNEDIYDEVAYEDIEDTISAIEFFHFSDFFNSYDYYQFKRGYASPYNNIYEYILLKISIYAVLFDLIGEIEGIENNKKIYFDDHDVLKGLDKNQRKLLQNIADIRNRDSVINKYIKEYGLKKDTIETYISNLVNYFKELGINDNDECKERIDTNLKAIGYLNKLLELNSQWFYKKSI